MSSTISAYSRSDPKITSNFHSLTPLCDFHGIVTSRTALPCCIKVVIELVENKAPRLNGELQIRQILLKVASRVIALRPDEAGRHCRNISAPKRFEISSFYVKCSDVVNTKWTESVPTVLGI